MAQAAGGAAANVKDHINDTVPIGNGSLRKKRKRTKTDNPLSDARLPQQKSASKSKKQLQVESLWHRKSGVGYSLFVSYYNGQPPGVVVMGNKEAKSTRQSHESAIANRKGGGQSRASKRRKKKKGKSQEDQSNKSVSDASDLSKERPVSELASSPLFQALKVSSENCMLLSPFLSVLSRPLPLTFRLRGHSDTTNNRDYKPELKKLRDGLAEHSALVAPVPYENSIYQSSSAYLSKSNLHTVSPSLKALLVENSANGMLARQELGSMLPVLALSGGGWIMRGSRVLDMCASPGSKTLQALEVVASDRQECPIQNKSRDSQIKQTTKTKRGRVVANDVHPARLEALKEAIDRSGLPSRQTSQITYTNFDASCFPSPNSGKLFDAIVADVPCSGDGTIRKDAHILPMWTPTTGNALHDLQVRILVRALELVKVDGVVCYSTCSLNPVEDEAVVAGALKRIHQITEANSSNTPAVEVIDWPPNVLPGFIRRNGVSAWRVAHYTGDDVDEDESFDLQWCDSYKDAVKAGMAHAEPTMWPSSDRNTLHLERCTRLLPQDQDTGGFFVALLQKHRQLTTTRVL